MKRYVLTHNEIEGFHCYPDAPSECSFLANKHRHVFVIDCCFEVLHNEREIEIITQQQEIERAVNNQFGKPCKFENMSCESIAEWIILKFNAYSVTVKEDGYGGATLTR